ncbi:MAG: hypothetical protein KQH83_07690 [Actinobacteria bacterium]|nr:hypothetical protein [Actinomycetota bacterium]
MRGIATHQHAVVAGLAGIVAGALLAAAVITPPLARAGDGDTFLLGKKNVALHLTKLVAKNGFLVKSTRGVPLTIEAPDGQPPLAVDSAARVMNLNADLLDGADGAAYMAVTSPLAIAAAEFQPVWPDRDVAGEGHMWVTQTDSARLTAPVRLPDGATITRMTVNCIDDTAVAGLVVELRRDELASSDGGATIAHAQTRDADDAPSMQTIEDDGITEGREVVDNGTYAYYLLVAIDGGGLKLFDAAIEFTVP